MGAKCGTQIVTDAAKCGTDTVTDAALCGTELAKNGADCLAEVVPDDLVDAISALPESMQKAVENVATTVVDLSNKLFDKAAEGTVKIVKSHVTKAGFEQSFNAIKKMGADLLTRVADKIQ